MKSDTETAIIAFRNRVAENCNAEVTLEDAVKGDKPSNGFVETVVMLLRGVIRTIKEAFCTGARRVETVGRHLKDCSARNQHKSLNHSGRRCWRDEQNESQI